MNEIIISGTIIGNPEFSHEVYGEKFYNFYIDCERKSGTVDTLMCVMPDMFLKNLKIGEKNKLIGEIRTRNEWVNDKSHLQVFIFVKEVVEYDGKDINDVSLEGYIIRQPYYRITPLGREISDFIIAHNNKYGRANYIPSIAWGRNAKKVVNMEIGTKIFVKGRLQSRHYRKFVDGEYFDKVAYELSVNTIEIVEGGVIDES